MTEIAGFNWQLEIRDISEQLFCEPLDLISFSVSHNEEMSLGSLRHGTVIADFACEVDHILPDFSQPTGRRDTLHLKRRDDTGHYGIFRNCRMSSFCIMHTDYSSLWNSREIKRVEWSFLSQHVRIIPTLFSSEISHVVDWRKSGF
jgi:hypothetical protein